MAIFTPSTVISEIRGSIGLETYSRNRYRPYVKARVSPIQPNTTYQLGSRAVMQYVCSEYNALTEEQKLIYEVAASQQKGIARIGEKPALTGRDLFIRIRTIFAYSGVVDPDTPAGLRPLPLFINFKAALLLKVNAAFSECEM